MPSSFFTSKQLEVLYINKGQSTYAIAEKVGCDPKTVFHWLKKYKIPTRKKKIISISKTELNNLYQSKLSLRAIGNKLGCTPSAVLSKCRKYGIKTRSPWETNTIHKRTNFSNSLEEKAYLIGFRTGDLNVKQRSIQSSIIVKSSTTHPVQVQLLKELFTKYGPVWISRAKYSPAVFHFSTSLNKSFSFLLPRYYSIPKNILQSKKIFLAFLAGYTDAEGTIRIYDNKARFRIGSYDKEILYQIHKLLLSWNITNTFRLETKAGKYKYGIHNGDFYRIGFARKDSINTCLNLLLPYLRHQRRRSDAILALKNIQSRQG